MTSWLFRTLGAAAAATLLALAPSLAQAPAPGQAPPAAQAQPAPAAPARPQPVKPPAKDVTIGYVELADDPRYNEDYAYARIQLRALGRPFAGAEVGLQDAESIGRVINVNFKLDRKAGASVDELAAAIDGWLASDTHYVIADLPAAALLDLANRMAGKPVVFLNVSAYEDSLRGAECRANVLHVIPSYSMLTDALVQYIVTRNWRDILVLQGPLPEDKLLVEALERSAQRFGADITDTKPFLLTNDPRLRNQSNVALLTAGGDYDVVFLADTDGEFGRYVPYTTNLPRPVIGTTGLVPEAWHWSWERQGAPQVNSRFERHADRRMTGFDWAAFVAVKAVVQSVLRTKSTEFDTTHQYMLSDKLNLDGTKGNPMTFRSWDHQLRQPLLVTTHNAIIERPPLDGFLHQTNELDTLGVDAPETACRF